MTRFMSFANASIAKDISVFRKANKDRTYRVKARRCVLSLSGLLPTSVASFLPQAKIQNVPREGAAACL